MQVNRIPKVTDPDALMLALHELENSIKRAGGLKPSELLAFYVMQTQMLAAISVDTPAKFKEVSHAIAQLLVADDAMLMYEYTHPESQNPEYQQ